MTPKDKYMNVWIYHRLTDSLKRLMDEGEMSPTDVIESARLACEMHFSDAAAVYEQQRELDIC
jgi:hypothetical protein